jgi:molybdopterin molybdotransferase
VITSGGVSVGEEDHVKAALALVGQIDLWRVAIKPGKPLACGRVGAAAFIGLPGNPVSAFVTFVMLVRPFLLASMGVRDTAPAAVPVKAAFDWPTPDPRREFLRARLNAQGGAEIFPHQGSAALSSTVWADGLVDVPPGTPVVRGQLIRYLPFAGVLV